MTVQQGCDLSKWNDSNMIYKQDFVILRAGYGDGNEDKKFKVHLKECRKHGKPIGVYWFSYARNEEMARDEADSCIEVLLRYGERPLYPVYFDWEYDSAKRFKERVGRDFDVSELNSMTRAFCNRLEDRGYYAGVYMNKDYQKKYNLDGKYTIWLADYSNDSFEDRPREVHMIQTGSTPYDKDICRIDFPSIIRKQGLNGW